MKTLIAVSLPTEKCGLIDYKSITVQYDESKFQIRIISRN